MTNTVTFIKKKKKKEKYTTILNSQEKNKFFSFLFASGFFRLSANNYYAIVRKTILDAGAAVTAFTA